MADRLSRRSFLGLAPGSPAAAAVPTAFFESVASAAAAGKPVAEIVFSHQTTGGEPDMARKVSEDLEKLGLRVKLRPMSLQAWLDAMTQRAYGDMTNRVKTPLPQRIADPESLLFETYHSSQAQSPRYNFGNYKQPEFDKWYELQAKEFDTEEAARLHRQGVNVIAADYFDCFRGNGPNVLHVYNKDWTGGIGTAGYGLAGTAFNWTWPLITLGLRQAPRGRGPAERARPHEPVRARRLVLRGQYVFDRLATLDQNLKIVPWALESYTSKDAVTWDVVLRSGHEVARRPPGHRRRPEVDVRLHPHPPAVVLRPGVGQRGVGDRDRPGEAGRCASCASSRTRRSPPPCSWSPRCIPAT